MIRRNLSHIISNDYCSIKMFLMEVFSLSENQDCSLQNILYEEIIIIKETLLIKNIINESINNDVADDAITDAFEAIDELDFTRAKSYLNYCLSISDSIEQRALCLSFLFMIDNAHAEAAHHILQKAYR